MKEKETEVILVVVEGLQELTLSSRTNLQNIWKNNSSGKSPHVRKFGKSGYLNPGKFCLWNPESWSLESGIPETTGMQNPSSSDQDWNPVPGIWNPRRGNQNLRHGAVERVIILQRIFYVAVKRRRWIELKLKRANTMVLKMAFGGDTGT